MTQQQYVAGMDYQLRFGGVYGEDQHGVCLYGDVSHPAAQFACDAAGDIEHPDQATLTDHQKVCFWFRFAEIRPYGKVQDLFDQVVALLENKGWKMAPAIEGLPDTGSSIGDLADTVPLGSPHYRDEAEFPPEPSAHGYNAAKSISIVVEKLGTQPVFTAVEIDNIRHVAKRASRLVYGRELLEME